MDNNEYKAGFSCNIEFNGLSLLCLFMGVVLGILYWNLTILVIGILLFFLFSTVLAEFSNHENDSDR